MDRVVSPLAQALSLGMAALALATGPSFAFGTFIGPNSAVSPLSQANPPAAPISPNSAVSPVSQAEQLPAQYSPNSLEFGTLKGYQNERRTETLSITVPAAGTVEATVLGQRNGSFQINSMARFGAQGEVVWINGKRVSLTRNAPLELVNGSGPLHAQAGDQILVEVALQANANLPPVLTAQLEVASDHWRVDVPVRAFVIQQPEIVVELPTGEFKIAPGSDATATIRLNRTLTPNLAGPGGMARDVTITAPSLPPGITMQPVTARVPADVPFVDASVHFHAADTTPPGRDQVATLRVDTGADRFTFNLLAQVYPTSVTWHYDQQVGDVHHTGDITIASNGSWKWKAHLHDGGTAFGDDYSVGFWIKAPYVANQDGSYPFGYATGQLGGGVFGGSRDADIERSSDVANFDPYYNPAGPSQWLREHYIEAVDGGAVVDGNASIDPTPAMKAFFDKLAGLFGAG